MTEENKIGLAPIQLAQPAARKIPRDIMTAAPLLSKVGIELLRVGGVVCSWDCGFKMPRSRKLRKLPDMEAPDADRVGLESLYRTLMAEYDVRKEHADCRSRQWQEAAKEAAAKEARAIEVREAAKADADFFDAGLDAPREKMASARQ